MSKSFRRRTSGFFQMFGLHYSEYDRETRVWKKLFRCLICPLGSRLNDSTWTSAQIQIGVRLPWGVTPTYGGKKEESKAKKKRKLVEQKCIQRLTNPPPCFWTPQKVCYIELWSCSTNYPISSWRELRVTELNPTAPQLGRHWATRKKQRCLHGETIALWCPGL